MKFYVKYGCSECHETLIVEAESFERADEFAEGAAQDVYYSYDCNYPSEQEYMDILNNIEWTVEPFDENNEEHMEALHECGVPHEI